MSKDDIFQDYPHQLRSGTDPNAPVYKRLPGFYAVHGRRADKPGVEPVQTFEDGAIAILKGEPDPTNTATDAANVAATRSTLGPVYAQQPGGATGSMAVPTGRILIRFADGVNAVDHEAEIRNAGYEVDQPLDYAPNAAWLRVRSGNIADALNGIDALRKLAGVENVEPQLLMQASYR
jgi:hypothetical protein